MPSAEHGSGYATAPVHHPRRRRGGNFAVCGARAAAGDAGDRATRSDDATRVRGTARSVSPRPERSWLCRRPQRSHRISLGGRPVRSAVGAGRRSCSLAVIVTLGGNAASVAAKAATATIPVVFHGSVDPVEAGLVASLNRPGGNVTGVVTLNMETEQKRLELMHELLPAAIMIGLLLNPTNAVAENQSKDLQAAARTLGLQLRIANASTEHDFDAAFATLSQGQVRGLVIGTDGFLVSQSEQLAALTARYALPTIFQYRAFVMAGGLMSYGGSVTDSYRLSGVYTGRILKGEKPADLPVQQATKIELIINLKTAKKLGITFPLSLLGRADEVIE